MKLAIFRKVLSQLRVRLIALALIATLPAFGLILYMSDFYAEKSTKHVLAMLDQQVEIINKNYQRILSDTHQLLSALIHLPEVVGGQGEACSRLFAMLRHGYGHYANIGAITADGDVFCSAVRQGRSLNAVGQEWYDRARSSRSFTVGDYHVGRITGIPVVVTALSDDGGQTVVFASIDLDSLDVLMKNLSLSENGIVVKYLDQHGVILTRYPRLSAKNAAMSFDIRHGKAIASMGKGVLEDEGIDGVSRLYAYDSVVTKYGHHGFLVAGVEKSELVKKSNNIRDQTLTSLGMLTVLVLALAWFGGEAMLARPLGSIIRTARRLAQGDLGARTGLEHAGDEIAELAKSFDDMAQLLQEHDTKVVRLVDELQRSESKLRDMLRTLNNTAEEERKKIARNIHDDIGGMLAALKMDVNLLSSKIKQANPGVGVQLQIRKTVKHIDELMDTVRVIISDLRPSILDNLGLLEAIQWQLSEFSQIYGIQYHFDKYLDDEHLVFNDVAHPSSIFRIFQEIITNAVRHSGASVVTVFVTGIENHFVLCVSDNGRGLDSTQPVRPDAFGLLGIRERVHVMQGVFEIVSKMDMGTTIMISIPCITLESGGISSF